MALNAIVSRILGLIRIKSGALTLAGLLWEAFSRTYSGALSLGGVVTRTGKDRFARTMSGALSLAGIITRTGKDRFARTRTGALTLSGIASLIPNVRRAYSGAITFANAITVWLRPNRIVSGALSLAGEVTTAARYIGVGVLNLGGAVSRFRSVIQTASGSLSSSSILTRFKQFWSAWLSP